MNLHTHSLNVIPSKKILEAKFQTLKECEECKEKNDTLKELQKQRIDELNLLGKKAFCLKDGKGQIYPLL
mgnify:CR=1 FL=1